MSETLEPALPDHLDEQAERLMHKLCDKGLTVATAESCTGGMLAALLTDIEGAGHGFERGFVTYSKDSKAELLGIEPSLLDLNDAVSEVVARAMAEGALKRSRASLLWSHRLCRAGGTRKRRGPRPFRGRSQGWSHRAPRGAFRTQGPRRDSREIA